MCIFKIYHNFYNAVLACPYFKNNTENLKKWKWINLPILGPGQYIKRNVSSICWVLMWEEGDRK